MAVGVPQPHSLLQGLQRPSEIGARPADTRGRSILVTGRWRLELATSGRRSELELLTLDAPGDYSVREKGSNTDGRPTRTPLCSQFVGRRCPSDPARPHVSTRAAATLPIPPRMKATEPGPRHAVILEPDGFVADGATLLDTPAHRRRGRQQAGQSTVSGCRRRAAMQSRSLATGRGRGCPARVGGRGGGLIVGAATRHRVRKLGRCR